MYSTIRRILLALFAAACVSAVCSTVAIDPASAQRTEVKIHLRGGSSINATIDLSQLQWQDVEQQTEPIDWGQVRDFHLLSASVNEQLGEIDKLIKQLSNSRYRLREEAERQLSKPEVAGPFKSVIMKSAAESTNREAAYRLNRIMGELEFSEQEDVQLVDCDRMYFKDASVRRGDFREFRIECEAFGKKLVLGRSQIGRISFEAKPAPTPTPATIATETFNQVGDEFYKDGADTMISFENENNGKLVGSGQDLGQVFVDRGLLMKTEKEGFFVRLINYRFKFCPIDSGKYSAGPSAPGTGRKLRGAVVLNFCLPGQPTTVAGVHKFGVFLERIEHSRDFVVEAYNALGQMIGMVESTDQICTFAGFKSNELITQIRIASNTDLPDSIESVDETHCFDCLTFDTPQKVVGLTRHRDDYPHNAHINLRSGDSILVDDLSLDLENVSFKNPLTGVRSDHRWDEVNTICFPQFAVEDSSGKRNFVQLKNGSIIRVESKSVVSAYDFVGYQFEQDDIVGVWDSAARVPLQSDFESGAPILAYPSCRILAKGLDFETSGVRWDADGSEKIIQQVNLADGGADHFTEPEEPYPDLTPTADRFEFSDKSGVPSVWLQQPLRASFGNGHLLLNNGQYFVLDSEGKQNGFRLTEIDMAKKLLVVELGEHSKVYPLARVLSLSLPKSN